MTHAFGSFPFIVQIKIKLHDLEISIVLELSKYIFKALWFDYGKLLTHKSKTFHNP